MKLKEQFYTCFLLYVIAFFSLFVHLKATGYFSELRYQVVLEFSDFAPVDSQRVFRLLLHWVSYEQLALLRRMRLCACLIVLFFISLLPKFVLIALFKTAQNSLLFLKTFLCAFHLWRGTSKIVRPKIMPLGGLHSHKLSDENWLYGVTWISSLKIWGQYIKTWRNKSRSGLSCELGPVPTLLLISLCSLDGLPLGFRGRIYIGLHWVLNLSPMHGWILLLNLKF